MTWMRVSRREYQRDWALQPDLARSTSLHGMTDGPHPTAGENERLHAGPSQVRRADQAVVPAADDDRVVGPGH